MRWNLLLGLLLFCFPMNGCVAVVAGGAGAGAVAFAKGEYQTSYERPYDQTWQATIDTMQEMNITPYNTSKSGGLFQGKRTDGTEVRIVLQSVKPERTEIKVRVGNLGDEEYSRMIDRKIQARLGIK